MSVRSWRACVIAVLALLLVAVPALLAQDGRSGEPSAGPQAVPLAPGAGEDPSTPAGDPGRARPTPAVQEQAVGSASKPDASLADNRTQPAADPEPRVLPERMQGRPAVRALGDRLPAVAASNGLSPAGFEELLVEDDTVWLTPEGRVYFEEEAPAEVTTTSGGAAPSVAAAYAVSETFTLHSRPDATRKIFLDFDGANVTRTGWNTSRGGSIPDGVHTGFDTDGSPSTFSASEHGFIQEVWRQVAESYAPFDVDVTTQDPGVAAITRSSASDTTYGTHVVVTSSEAPRAAVCGGCLGVAYLGTFNLIRATPDYQPAWVFAYNKGFDPMTVAQAATHETGHNLGLTHDGTTSTDYYAGTRTWGPVMGSSMNRAVSQFSIGEYARANNTQNDFAVMQSTGLPLRTDDHGGTVQTATPLTASTSYDVSGVISTRTDTDVFAITRSCVSELRASVTGIGAQTALDLKLDLLDADGRVLVSNSPVSGYTGTTVPVSTGMNASLVRELGLGTYYLRVDGVGNGDPLSGGWSDYGSLGQYRLTATGCPTTPTDPLSPSPTPSPTPSPGPSPAPGATPSPSAPAVSAPKPTAAPAPKPTAPKPPAPKAPAPKAPAPKAPAPKAPAPQVKKPTAPRIGVAAAGARRGPKTALVRWGAPVRTGGAAITRYRVVAFRLNARNRVVRTFTSGYQRASARSLVMRLPRGRYVFKVMAQNRAGSSPWSPASRVVRAR